MCIYIYCVYEHRLQCDKSNWKAEREEGVSGKSETVGREGALSSAAAGFLTFCNGGSYTNAHSCWWQWFFQSCEPTTTHVCWRFSRHSRNPPVECTDLKQCGPGLGFLKPATWNLEPLRGSRLSGKRGLWFCKDGEKQCVFKGWGNPCHTCAERVIPVCLHFLHARCRRHVRLLESTRASEWCWLQGSSLLKACPSTQILQKVPTQTFCHVPLPLRQRRFILIFLNILPAPTPKTPHPSPRPPSLVTTWRRERFHWGGKLRSGAERSGTWVHKKFS